MQDFAGFRILFGDDLHRLSGYGDHQALQGSSASYGDGHESSGDMPDAMYPSNCMMRTLQSPTPPASSLELARMMASTTPSTAQSSTVISNLSLGRWTSNLTPR